ncbi:hypothetical protein GLYMA_03G259450v4 [Glycine max]|nr:hypothetical protein GLYMA_03G259450v4 [Glycine max]
MTFIFTVLLVTLLAGAVRERCSIIPSSFTSFSFFSRCFMRFPLPNVAMGPTMETIQ